ncbi:unnamed protein product [Caenorhabditis bovis]|uniref:C2H2-type domain-containing protein n=1 Tax=Caenorhabditis bovis TaxID=2654633 RepID=A0A8S1ETI3_9PELO|nr:unnamed protein product [Caenorhabditis bovis]
MADFVQLKLPQPRLHVGLIKYIFRHWTILPSISKLMYLKRSSQICTIDLLKFIGTRIETTNHQTNLLVDSPNGDSILKIPITPLSLEEQIIRLKQAVYAEKQYNEELEAKITELTKLLEEKTKECDGFRLKCKYQEKEISLLREIAKHAVKSDDVVIMSDCEVDEEKPSTSETPKNTGKSIGVIRHAPASLFRSANDDDCRGRTPNMIVNIVRVSICNLCPDNQNIVDVNTLEQHLLENHVDKEKQLCVACPDEKTDKNTDIIRHMKNHTNNVYACTKCGKRGKITYLRSHVRTHTGERPYSCETCKRAFSDSSTLRRHRVVHTGIKKYLCSVCGKPIARRDNVKVHIKSHGITPDEIREKGVDFFIRNETEYYPKEHEKNK